MLVSGGPKISGKAWGRVWVSEYSLGPSLASILVPVSSLSTHSARCVIFRFLFSLSCGMSSVNDSPTTA